MAISTLDASIISIFRNTYPRYMINTMAVTPNAPDVTPTMIATVVIHDDDEDELSDPAETPVGESVGRKVLTGVLVGTGEGM